MCTSILCLILLWKIYFVRSFNIVLLYELTIYSYDLYLVLTVELEAIRQKLYSLDVYKFLRLL